jgi:hypothetical protein
MVFRTGSKIRFCAVPRRITGFSADTGNGYFRVKEEQKWHEA